MLEKTDSAKPFAIAMDADFNWSIEDVGHGGFATRAEALDRLLLIMDGNMGRLREARRRVVSAIYRERKKEARSNG